jgi:hypothetical protein
MAKNVGPNKNQVPRIHSSQKHTVNILKRWDWEKTKFQKLNSRLTRAPLTIPQNVGPKKNIIL